MANKKSTITIDDVHSLIDVKSKDPNIAPEELYRQVDKVHPNYGKEMWRFLWMPLVLSLVSLVGMSFSPINNVWNRLSIIGFVIASIWAIYLLRKYGKSWWWIPLLSVTILYLIFAESLSLKELMKYITDLL